MNSEALQILLVEDNPDHAELVLAAMEDFTPAPTVVHVTDGAEAIAYVRDQALGGRPAPGPLLVLLDLRLPRVDGLEVLRVLKADAALSLIPIVVLTTSDSDSDVAAAYANHANSYVVKPLGFVALRQVVAQLIRYWSELNRSACR